MTRGSKAVVVDVAEKAVPSFIAASRAEQGHKYTGWQGITALWWTGRTKEAAGRTLYVFEGVSDLGDAFAEFEVAANYPLMDDEAAVGRVMAEFARRRQLAAGKRPAKTGTVEAMDPATGEVVIKERPRAAKPRAAADPRTGCQPGTDGHRVGEVVLRYKPKDFDRKLVIDLVVSELKMGRGLAASWVSTLIKRKEQFKAYGRP